MTIMWPMPAESKRVDLPSCFSELDAFVRSAARDGLPAHELERGLWQRFLQLGYHLQGQYFALANADDPGATVTLADGREVRRLPKRHSRPYQSIFGKLSELATLSTALGAETVVSSAFVLKQAQEGCTIRLPAAGRARAAEPARRINPSAAAGGGTGALRQICSRNVVPR